MQLWKPYYIDFDLSLKSKGSQRKVLSRKLTWLDSYFKKKYYSKLQEEDWLERQELIEGYQIGSLCKVHTQKAGIKGGCESNLKGSYKCTGKSHALDAKKWVTFESIYSIIWVKNWLY